MKRLFISYQEGDVRGSKLGNKKAHEEREAKTLDTTQTNGHLTSGCPRSSQTNKLAAPKIDTCQFVHVEFI